MARKRARPQPQIDHMTLLTHVQHSHCSFCGGAYPADQAWPRLCPHCHNTTFRNPLPVTIVVVPVDAGVLVVRRDIAPHRGKFALPGGYIEVEESWQEAGAREVYEEAGLTIDPADIQLLTVYSAGDGTLIIVGQAAPMREQDLSGFIINAEVSARSILYAPTELAWPLHTQAVTAYFARRGDVPA